MSDIKDSAKPQLRDILTSPRLGAVVVMGVASGLPFNLTESTMQAWLKDAAISNTTIGWLSLVGLAYALKPFWAPLLDRFSMPFLGRRRGWILVFQLALAAALAAMATHGPEQGLAPLRRSPWWWRFFGVAGHRHRRLAHRSRLGCRARSRGHRSESRLSPGSLVFFCGRADSCRPDRLA